MPAHKPRIKKVRLDQLLVDQGLVDSKSKAQSMIMAGEVYMGEEKQRKAGHKVSANSVLTIRQVIQNYVSRGGLKLQGALEDFNIDVNGFVCFDVGASTGGFTDCLLQKGAQHVYCLDVGKNQLHYKLQEHAQVTWKESLHIKDFDAQHSYAQKNLSQTIDLVVADCSFIALEKVLPFVIPVMHEKTQIIALIKPQFQAQKKDLSKGVLKDEVKRQEIIAQCIQNIEITLPLSCMATSDAKIKGPKGNQECFVCFKKVF